MLVCWIAAPSRLSAAERRVLGRSATHPVPATFHRDPADRILVATARVFGATLLTHDDAIRASGLAAVLR